MIIEPNDTDVETIYNRISKNLYDLQPDFQRDLVWNTEKQQKLIDSLMRGWHIPPIHLVKIEGKESFEVLDGKQRLYSICNFLSDRFPFDSRFIPGTQEFRHIHGKKFSQMPEEIKRRFLFTKIRIFEVRDVRMNEATELFLRLNQGVTVMASEKRNCIYGPIKNFLRKEVLLNFKDTFNPNVLGFANLRMAYQDVIDKIFFLEKNQSLEIKPGSKALEQMYFDKALDPVARKNFLENLFFLRDILKKLNSKMTKSLIITYYWFLREIKILSKNSPQDKAKASEFLPMFEKWRENQRIAFEKNKSFHPAYVEFETFLNEGWLDPSSLKGRHRILMDFFRDYSNTEKFGEYYGKI